MPWEFYPLISQHLGWRYWLSDPAHLRAHEAQINSIEAILADEESRQSYRRIVRFRSGEDFPYASFRHADEQYFNSITLAEHTRNRGCYVDCGAYDGDTYLRYLQKVGEPSRAILLEPDRSNFRQLVARTAAMKSDVICLPLAVSDNLVSLRFTETSGEASSVGDHGTVVVQAIALDQLLASQRVGFLKLDVEGAEKAALHGAKTILSRDRPVVTMSLYHRPEDIWELPEILREYCKNYSFYLRQHYFNSFDSVLYAIPRLC
jgi:FkbM family methyltransferase